MANDLRSEIEEIIARHEATGFRRDDHDWWIRRLKLALHETQRVRVQDADDMIIRTRTGRVLTEADIQLLADEAEQGYDVSHLIDPPRPTAEAIQRWAEEHDYTLTTYAEPGCTCAPVHIGNVETGTRNWNPDCPVHIWDERLQAQSDRAVEMQRRAREARARVRGAADDGE